MGRPRIRFSPIKVPGDIVEETEGRSRKVAESPVSHGVNPSVDLEDDGGYKSEESYNYEELDSSFLSPITGRQDVEEGEFDEDEYEGSVLKEKPEETKELKPKELKPKELKPKELKPKELRPKELGPKVRKETDKPIQQIEQKVPSLLMEEPVSKLEVTRPKSPEPPFPESDPINESDVDAESTIIKVTQFIGEKRRLLEDNDKKIESITKPRGKKRTRDDEKGQKSKKRSHGTKQDVVSYCSSTSDWTSEQWTRLYNYLGRWRLTKDSSMMKVDRLETKFGCDIEELEVRVRTLRNLVDRKKRDMFRQHLDQLFFQQSK
ncbi:hypothetical protein FOA43_000549 [Brettanomyces nanus]|uniref:Uncharacterized protein n=1 Tax=Eeniella nana TaxID=13502 RepID=A0A875RVZ1_EENNA|nr:uncharacterized protein FOA43_000549 [Brettanomyces nanus]QPG73241.1 hypothetical protein FOA43_000549 [Brettanomyces nanus]